MNDHLADLRERVDMEKGRTEALRANKRSTEANIQSWSAELDAADRAAVITQKAGQAIQHNLKIRVSGLVTETLRAVFPNPYEFEIRFQVKRNNTEAELLFTRDGEEFDPLTAAGGGVVDVASFGLRIAALLLTQAVQTNLRSTLVMDEPFRFVSRDLQPRVREMVDRISSELGVQFIIISHESGLLEGESEAGRN